MDDRVSRYLRHLRLFRILLVSGLTVVLLIAALAMSLRAGVADTSHAVGATDRVMDMAAASLAPLAPSPLTQWCVMPLPSLADSNLEDLEVISPTDIWAVGSVGSWNTARTLTMHWDGTTWSVVSSPNHAGLPDSVLYGVAAVTSSDVWAVGRAIDQDNQITSTRQIVLHWNGTQWSLVPTPDLGPAVLAAVDAVAPNDVWAVGYRRLISPETLRQTLILHWNGSTWSQVASPNPGAVQNILSDVYAAAPNDVWAVGYWADIAHISQRAALTLHWNGNQWSIVPNPLGSNPETGNPRFLQAVHGSSSSDVWAVGFIWTSTSPYHSIETVTMHWDGTSWTRMVSPSPGQDPSLYGVTTISPNDAWAVGGYTPGSIGEPLVLHWNGGGWNQIANPDLEGDYAYLSGADFAPDMGTLMVGRRNDPTTFVSNPLILQYSEHGCGLPPSPTPASPTATPTPCAAGTFSDVPTGSTFHPFVQCLAQRGIVSGYSDCTFRPNSEVTRGQLAKIVSNAAGFSESPEPQIFEDVPPSNTFYQWINRLARRGHMSGYTCGGPGEPCTTGMPYFRPSANANRGQTSKIVSNAAGFAEIPTEQTFEDVPPSHTFYREIQRLASRNIMAGYPCGGAGEPCVSGKPYFRPQNNVTRGQSAKIVANTFFPGCQTP